MQDLQNLQTSQLVDLLAEKTTLLTAMFAGKKFGDEYEKHKLLLKAIQTEIDFRKTIADITPTNINSSPDFTV